MTKSEGNGNGGRPPFSRERGIAGLLMIGLAVVLALIDPFLPDFTVDPVEYALIVGTGCLLLGVEGAKLFFRG